MDSAPVLGRQPSEGRSDNSALTGATIIGTVLQLAMTLIAGFPSGAIPMPTSGFFSPRPGSASNLGTVVFESSHRSVQMVTARARCRTVIRRGGAPAHTIPVRTR